MTTTNNGVVVRQMARNGRNAHARYASTRSYSETNAIELERQAYCAVDGRTTKPRYSHHLSMSEDPTFEEEEPSTKTRHCVYRADRVTTESCTDKPTSPPRCIGLPARRDAAHAHASSLDSNTSIYDVTGLGPGSRFPWQRDIGVQCCLLRPPPHERRGDSSRVATAAGFKSVRHLKLGVSLDSATPTEQLSPPFRCTPPTRSQSDARSATASPPKLCSSGVNGRLGARCSSDVHPQKKTPHRKKRSEQDGELSSSLPSRHPSRCRTVCPPSRSGSITSSSDSLAGLSINGRSQTFFADDDLGKRKDTLPSPRTSPVPWLNDSLPQLVVARHTSESGAWTASDGSDTSNHLTVPRRQHVRRIGVGGYISASDDSDADQSPPMSRRGRRQAIFDPKGLGLVTAPDGELSPSNSCDESEGSCSSNSQHCDRATRKRSSADLGVRYPGDLVGQRRQRHHHKVLIKRNTIADFAVNKAYQASTASLISEQDSKKLKGTFSLLKLIDKKTHKTKDALSQLSDVLLTIKPSEFRDSCITCYKDVHWSELIASKDKDGELIHISETERKRREAVWELFTSECVFLVDHIMVLKHCFMEPLKKVQVEGHLMFAEPQDLFGNIDELCYVSYTFCRDFISLLLKDAGVNDFGRTAVVSKALQRLSQLTRDGEVYHDYCLNYSKAITYLEQLRKNEDFCEFEKYCELDPRCHRLQLTDLLISPMHRCTKVPLLLSKIRKYTQDSDERQHLSETLEKLEESLKSLEVKMKWLKNFERVQMIQQQLVWQPITEMDPRAYVPEFLKQKLNHQPCERLLASPKRQLLHEGPLTLLEVSKTVDMHMFLFDDILLLTRIKKPARKKTSDPMTQRNQTDGAIFVVHKQPIALDRFTLHDVRPPDAADLLQYMECGMHISVACEIPAEYLLRMAYDDECNSQQRPNLLFGCLPAASDLKNAFVLVQISRFQQVIGAFTLQAPTETAKTSWMTQLREAQEKYSASVSRSNSRPPKLSRDDHISLVGSAELDVGVAPAPSIIDIAPHRSMWATVRQAWLSQVSSDHLRSSTESIETRITHVGSGSDESLNGNNNNGVVTRQVDGQCCRLADNGKRDAQLAPHSVSQLSLPREEVAKTDKALSPHAQRISRLIAIREKSQSLDAIYI